MEYREFYIDDVNSRIRKEISTLEIQRQKVFDLHREGKYTDSEFIQQKNIINEQILHKELLVQETRNSEFDMEKALNYCFGFIRTASK